MMVRDDEIVYISGASKRRRRRKHIGSFSVTLTPFETSIDISWEKPPGLYIDKYDIYRDGVLITTTTSLSYTDTSLTDSTTYTYKVSASNQFGGLSESESTTTTLPPPPP